MNEDDPLSRWLLSQLETMPLQILREGAGLRLQHRFLGRLMGEQEAEELEALLNRPAPDRDRPATVLLPGVLGSLLASVEGICALLWLNPTVILNGQMNLLDLNAEGTGDASPDVRIVPLGLEKLVYLKMVLALAHETRLYEFPYDWRRHLEWNARLLRHAIERWAQANPQRRFTLIGHSMGGMLARTYLALYPGEAQRRIERVVLLGSPVYGSPLSIMLFRGRTLHNQVFTKLHPSNDLVSMASNMPASYQLLPPPANLFPSGHAYPVNWDLYDAHEWGLPNLRQDYLDDARAWHQLVGRSDPQVPIVQIAGCHRRTLTDIWRVLRDEAGYAATAEGDFPGLTLVHQETGEDSGDNSVPLWSARCTNYLIHYVEEDHQLLPRNQKVIESVLSLAHGDTPGLPTELPEPLGLLDNLRGRPLVEQVAQLRERIEAGVLLREDLTRLFFAQ